MLTDSDNAKVLLGKENSSSGIIANTDDLSS